MYTYLYRVHMYVSISICTHPYNHLSSLIIPTSPSLSDSLVCALSISRSHTRTQHTHTHTHTHAHTHANTTEERCKTCCNTALMQQGRMLRIMCPSRTLTRSCLVWVVTRSS